MNKKIMFENVLSSKGRCKVIRLLSLKNEDNISNIVKETALNYTCVNNHLEYLKEIDFIQEKKYGRVRIFRFKRENLKANALRNLIIFWENQENGF